MKTLVILVLSLMVLALPGCGSDHYNPPPLFDVQILSYNTVDGDGDIAKPVGIGPLIITQGISQIYYAGFDPADGAELRAFLQFPLGGVPVDAVIQSATLNLNIYSSHPNPLVRSIPIRIDLVELQPPFLVSDDFYLNFQPALASTTISVPISGSYFNVFADVTSLMQEAQRPPALSRFQVRILVDPALASSGFIGINDSTGINRDVLAPLLDVSYY